MKHFCSTRHSFSPWTSLPSGVSLTLILALILAAFHTAYALYFYVPIPFDDTWIFFDANHGIPEGFSWSWLLRFHNEHRIFATRLTAWLLAHFWNFNLWGLMVALHTFYWGIYLTLLYIIYPFLSSRSQLTAILLLLSWACLFSPLNWHNLSLPFNIHFHSSILFGLWFSLSLHRNRPTLWHTLSGILWCFLASFSFSSGLFQITTTAFVTFCFWLFSPNQRRLFRTNSPVFWHRISLLVSVLLCGLLYFRGYERPASLPPLAHPFQWKLFLFYAEILDLGYGIRDLAPWISLSLLLLTHGYWLYSAQKVEMTVPCSSATSMKEVEQQRLFLILTLLPGLWVCLLGASVGRMGFGLGQAKAIRYVEWGLISLPLWTCLFLATAPRKTSYGRSAVIGFLLLAGFHDEWGFPGAYKNWHSLMTQGRQCLARSFSILRHSQGTSNADQVFECHYIGSGDLRRELEFSLKRGFEFTTLDGSD